MLVLELDGNKGYSGELELFVETAGGSQPIEPTRIRAPAVGGLQRRVSTTAGASGPATDRNRREGPSMFDRSALRFGVVDVATAVPGVDAGRRATLEWTGFVQLVRAGGHRFELSASGPAELTLGPASAETGAGGGVAGTQSVQLEPGWYPVTARLLDATGPAYMGVTFAADSEVSPGAPLEAWRLSTTCAGTCGRTFDEVVP